MICYGITSLLYIIVECIKLSYFCGQETKSLVEIIKSVFYEIGYKWIMFYSDSFHITRKVLVDDQCLSKGLNKGVHLL